MSLLTTTGAADVEEGKATSPASAATPPAEEEDEEEEEEEEVPEDLADLPPDMQQRKIKIRSAWMMGIGTLLVLVFSDPMVDVLSEFGHRAKVKPFYVAFVLAPLASNASELIASYNYALKKTQKV
jgi:Ca2+/H+ antiporter